MKKDEWDDMSWEYRVEAVKAALSMVALEEWERASAAFERNEHMFYEALTGREHDRAPRPIHFIVDQASKEFCEEFGARMIPCREGGWKGTIDRLGPMLMLDEHRRASHSARFGGNMTALLSGLERNPRAPKDACARVVKMGIYATMGARSDERARWATGGADGCARGSGLWASGWLAAVKGIAEDDASEHCAINKRAGGHAVDSLATHWSGICHVAARDALGATDRPGWEKSDPAKPGALVQSFATAFAGVEAAALEAVRAGWISADGARHAWEQAAQRFGEGIGMAGAGEKKSGSLQVVVDLAKATGWEFASAAAKALPGGLFGEEVAAAMEAAILGMSVKVGREPAARSMSL